MKRSILPPSLFLNSLNREGSSGEQHAVGGGASAVRTVLSILRVVFDEFHYQDIYKDHIQGTIFCFRVLRMFVTAGTLGEREKLYKVTFFRG